MLYCYVTFFTKYGHFIQNMIHWYSHYFPFPCNLLHKVVILPNSQKYTTDNFHSFTKLFLYYPTVFLDHVVTIYQSQSIFQFQIIHFSLIWNKLTNIQIINFMINEILTHYVANKISNNGYFKQNILIYVITHVLFNSPFCSVWLQIADGSCFKLLTSNSIPYTCLS